MAPLRSAGAVESEAGSPVMNHFLNTGAEGINHREEGFEESRGSAQVYALPPPHHPSPPSPPSSVCTTIAMLETDINRRDDLPGQPGSCETA